MHKIWVIAQREYLAAVRTKAFVVSLVFMPLLMIGSAGTPVLIDRLTEIKPQRFAIVDRTPQRQLFAALQAAAQRRSDEVLDVDSKQSRVPYVLEAVDASAETAEASGVQRFELSQRVRRGEIAGFLDIGQDVATIPKEPQPAGAPAPDRESIRYQSNSPLQDAFARWAERIVNEAVVAERCRRAGLSPLRVASLVQHVPLRIKGLMSRDVTTGDLEETSDSGRAGMFLAPAALSVLMFLVVMIGATPLMQSVIEEKMQRIAEVLLGAVRPFELMMGKLLGIVGVTLTLAILYLGGGYAALYRMGFTEYLSFSLLSWFLVYQVLAVIMYGSLFIAIGAACTDVKESQTLLIPLVTLITCPLFAMKPVVQEPNGAFALWASLIPFGTPMLMIMRLGLLPVVPGWQLVLGAAGMLATAALCVGAAGRIFRVGILMQGKGAKLGEVARWLFHGSAS